MSGEAAHVDAVAGRSYMFRRRASGVTGELNKLLNSLRGDGEAQKAVLYHPEGSQIDIGMDSSVVPLGDSGYSLVQTIDYFYPSVEDPYIAGKIACANVLSGLYALFVTRCDNILMVMAASTKLTEKQRDIVVPLLIKRIKDLAEQAGTRVTGGQTAQSLAYNCWRGIISLQIV
ncbi:hypothetical protein V5799_024590 [Amblyomma americanum]|uniref:PurM-like N-terminal domain-containing protein n=1 Tax=Amblyomma americanum TaxID=6943 RepID=A0AAQ4EBL0_AMBAM